MLSNLNKNRVFAYLFLFPILTHTAILWPHIHTGSPIPCCDLYGEGNGATHIKNVTCTGSEGNITTCTYFNVTVPSSHKYDVGVHCQQGWCN